MKGSDIDFTVFYSWQSDLPDNTNRRAIRSALRVASSTVEQEKANVRVILDEATRGESGSPNIPSTILDKIRASDAFICDITTINSSAPDVQRRTPNPNVIFELGYAVAHLGWGRIVMFFNEELGEFPNDTPFDMDRHRASPYRLALTDSANSSNHKKLANLATEAIRTIVNSQPQRPLELLQKTPDEIKNLRDVEKIKWAMNTIHIPTIDEMIISLPHHLDSKVFHFWESFNYVMNNSLFHIYDKELNHAFLLVHKEWHGCVSHGEQYQSAANLNIYVFWNPDDLPLSIDKQREWDEIESSCGSLRKALDKLLKIIRERFLGVNLDETNKHAWNEYVDFEKEMDREFKRKHDSFGSQEIKSELDASS